MGPAPKVPYNRNRGLYQFRWFYDYSGGQVTNMGIHYLDMIHWALGLNAPLAVTAMGGKFAIDDNREIPDTLEVLWQYPGDTLVSYTQFNANGAAATAKPGEVEFRGTQGTLYVRGNGWEVVPDAITPNEFPRRSPTDRLLERGWRKGEAPMIEPRKASGTIDTADHARNFLDCLKTRGVCNSDLESAHRSTSTTLLANIALRTKSQLQWDAQAEQFTNHPAANQFLRYDYRAPLKSPA
jgi:predicted dehydrogenase